jgi:hypothetical protein
MAGRIVMAPQLGRRQAVVKATPWLCSERNGFKAAFAFMTRRYCILDEAAARQQVRSGAGFRGEDGGLGRCART